MSEPASTIGRQLSALARRGHGSSSSEQEDTDPIHVLAHRITGAGPDIAADLARTWISAAEQEATTSTAERAGPALVQLAAVFGVPVGYFLGGDDADLLDRQDAVVSAAAGAGITSFGICRTRLPLLSALTVQSRLLTELAARSPTPLDDPGRGTDR